MKKFPSLLLTSAALALTTPVAKAQVFAKPTGSKAIPLRVQNLRAEVEIIGAVAITRWTMTLAMENVGFGGWYREGAVGDFVCVRPRDAKVTAFAVARQLVGRVEERAFATPRVAFRAAPNDPLLRSGLNAGNSFRATIYPLNNWSESTISGTWVQFLSPSPTGSTYSLPLLGLKGATTRLKELNVKITARDGALSTFSNNYNLRSKWQNGARVLTLGQKNYRVLRDFKVTFRTPKARQRILALVAPPKNAGEGFHFAFSFVANRAFNNLAVSGTGIEGVAFSKKSVRAGEVVSATGVYSGEPGKMRADLTAEGGVKIALTPVANEIAHPLWATQKINSLSANTLANRAQIISLSKAYSVVSPFTAWLAVGPEDLKIYRRALVSSQLDPLVREYWIKVADGKEKTARVAQIKKSITQISLANGLVVEDELYARLGSATNYLSWKGGWYSDDRAPKTAAEKRYVRLQNVYETYLKSLGIKSVRNGNGNQTYFATRDELATLRTQIIAEYRKPHPNYTQLNQWEQRFRQIYGSFDYDPRLAFWRARIQSQSLESQTTAAEQANDTAHISVGDASEGEEVT